MSDCNSGCIALGKVTVVRCELLSAKGAANPQGPGRKPPRAEGVLPTCSGLQAQCHHSNFLAGLDLSACGPKKESSCTPGDKLSWPIPSSSAQRSREGVLTF